ncbi:MAG: RnfABCDGE type electron transport complex subunit D, partial [Lachnospiraceae bacterium]|nr:RnfABCDGE type electron transport complex subunit D [Lachnospiraceae bacterium]
VTVSDLSAVVTGLLIGLNMPPEIAWWIPVIGSVFGIIVVKQLYGGLGQNFMNPALGARCFLLISFSGQMTTYTEGKGFSKLVTGLGDAASYTSMSGAEVAKETVDALSGATPLKYLKAGLNFDLKSLFFGNTLGVIGEASACALLIGGIFLVVMKIIEIRIPLTYLGSFAVLCMLTGVVRGYSNPLLFAVEELCAGGIMLGAWFMATDYVTSPITEKGQYIFGVLLGVLTWLFRIVSSSTAEGVSYAIIFSNCVVPMIEQYTRPRAFGVPKPEKKSKEDKA